MTTEQAIEEMMRRAEEQLQLHAHFPQPGHCFACGLARDVLALAQRIKDAELALVVWDEGYTSEYWERYAALASERP